MTSAIRDGLYGCSVQRAVRLDPHPWLYISKHHDPDPSRTRNARGSQSEVRPRTQALSDASTGRSCLGRVYFVAAGKDSIQVVLRQAEPGSLV
ncbi:hypothetical protein IG631_16961 [Alternaria alternata]|nr:hypothetical protein IG631_16961 [Alternaria alternata]